MRNKGVLKRKIEKGINKIFLFILVIKGRDIFVIKKNFLLRLIW